MTLFQGGWWWWHSPLNSHLNDGVGGPRCQATRWFTYWQLESTCTAGDPRGWIFVSTGTSGNPTKITAPNATKRNKGRIGRWCGSYWMNWHQVRFFGQGKLPQLRRFEFNKNHLSTKNSWTLKNWWFGKRNFHVWGVHVSFQGCSCVHVGRWLSECIRYFSIFEDEFHGCFNCSFRSSKIESWLCKNNLCVQWYLYIPGIEGCVIFLCDFACSTSGWISVGGLPFRSLKGKEDLCIIIIRWVRLSMSGNPKSYG